MKRTIYLTIIALLTIVITGCEEDSNPDPEVITGTGPVVTNTLELPSFNKIELTGTADFNITIGSPQSVVLSAQQNIIDVMSIKVEGETLKVGLKSNVSISSPEGIHFDITVPSMTKILLAGAGNFELSGSDQNELSVIITGVGDIRAFDMRVRYCNISVVGVGNCQVNVINGLAASITGVGNIYYKGSPTISSSVTGVGQIVNSN